MTPPAPPPLRRARPAQLLRSRGLNPREFVFRTVIITVICGSIFVAWWTFMKVLPPLQLQSRQLQSSLSKLSADVDEIDRQWPSEQMNKVTADYTNLHDVLFSDEASFGDWLAKLNAVSKPLALDAKADFGKALAVTAPGVKLAMIPATIFVDVQPAKPSSSQPPYHRFLQLAEQLGTDPKRADLTGLSLSGGFGSITNAVLNVELWAGEERRP